MSSLLRPCSVYVNFFGWNGAAYRPACLGNFLKLFASQVSVPVNGGLVSLTLAHQIANTRRRLRGKQGLFG